MTTPPLPKEDAEQAFVHCVERSASPLPLDSACGAPSATAAGQPPTVQAQVPQDGFAGIAQQRMPREFARTDAIVAGLKK